MSEILSDLLCTASGSVEGSSRETVQAIMEIVLSEINLLLCYVLSEDPVASQNLQNPVPFIRLLSYNEQSLIRFAKRTTVADLAKSYSSNIGSDAVAQASKAQDHGALQLRKCLACCKWTTDQIERLFNDTVGGMVKCARNARISQATLNMDDKTYAAFTVKRRASFLGLRNQAFLLPDYIAPSKTSPLVWDILAYLAAETVYIIVDLLMVLRYDFRNGTFLRYKVLKGVQEAELEEVAKAIECSVESPLTIAEVRNVCRLFCGNRMSNPTCSTKFKPLVLYL